MKKILVALLALAMVFTFASCNNNGKAPYEDWTDVGARAAKHDDSDGFGPDGNYNQGNYAEIESVEYEEGVITVTGDLEGMLAYTSTNETQAELGNCKWYALAISVGDELVSDSTLKIQGSATLEEARSDIDKYTYIDDTELDDDEFVLWCRADAPGTLTLERAKAEKLTIKINFVDSGDSTGSQK